MKSYDINTCRSNSSRNLLCVFVSGEAKGGIEVCAPEFSNRAVLENKFISLNGKEAVLSCGSLVSKCASYIEEHGFQTIEAVNTAVAAKQVADMGRHDVAAIGSEEAAELFGLCKLESHINESSNNTTRFAVFTRAQKPVTIKDNHFIILFTVKNTAGSLGRAISVIGEHGFNLRALKSRPTKELIWDYYFYAEGEGNLNSPEGQAMLTDLQSCCNSLKLLGCFEKEMKI